MGFNVSTISAEVGRLGVQRPNKFEMTFPMPDSLKGTTEFTNLTNTNRVMQLYCEATNLPGVANMLEDVRRYGYGPNEKMPYAPVFNDITLTFRGDAYGQIWTFLSSWMRCAINFESRGDFITKQGPIQNQYAYEVGYKKDTTNGEGYAVDAQLSMFDETGQERLRIMMRDAFPCYVGDVPLNWGSRSDYMRIPVTMCFFDWYNATPGTTQINNTANF